MRTAKVSVSGHMVSNKHAGAIIGHIGIEVASLTKSKKFYQALFGGLGFKVIMDSKEGLAFTNQNFSIWIGEMPEPRVKRKAPTGEEFVVADHLAIQFPDKNTVYEIEKKMKKQGFDPLFPCEEHPQFEPGYHAVSFCDPDNYVIEIYTRLEAKQF